MSRINTAKSWQILVNAPTVRSQHPPPTRGFAHRSGSRFDARWHILGSAPAATMAPFEYRAGSVDATSVGSPPLVCADKAEALRARYSLCPLLDSKLHKDVLDMGLHRLGRDAKSTCDFLVGFAFADTLENAALAGAQRLRNSRRRARGRLGSVTRTPACNQPVGIRRQFAIASGARRAILEAQQQGADPRPLIQYRLIDAGRRPGV